MDGAGFDRPVVQRTISFGVVVALHAALVLFLLAQNGTIAMSLPHAMLVSVLKPEAPPKPPPPVRPALPPPPAALEIPLPDIAVPPPPLRDGAPRAVVRVAPAPQAAHFGAAGGDEGLGVAVAAGAGGGGRARGDLGAFDAAVKQAVLAHKTQPFLAWDRRNTCVINYSATITRSGALAALHIDPCAVPEINAAAEEAVRAAAPFPPPPDLGGATTTVHGTLIFKP